MELRELRYFLAVAREESILKASEALYVSQPNLSRQMKRLEEELGQPLFLRGSRKITLTEAGELLRKRAEEILELSEKTEAELALPVSEIRGDISIGGGESYVLGLIARAARAVQSDYPAVKFHLFSGDMFSIKEKLDKGLIDFGIFIEPADLSKYEYLRLPLYDIWGVLMRKDSPLAKKEQIAPEDLWHVPLIRSRHSLGRNPVSDWFRIPSEKLNIVATYDLLYNASLLVEEGVGYAVGLEHIINTSGECALCFKPFCPRLISHLDIAWKKQQVFPKCAEIFLQRLREII